MKYIPRNKYYQMIRETGRIPDKEEYDIADLDLSAYSLNEDNCNFTYVDNEYIHLITVCDRDDGNVIAYDKNTKVLYLCVYGYSTMGITPIYNSDGSLKLYEEQ